MKTCDKGAACHVLQGKASQLTLISVADPEPLKRVMEELHASGYPATTERHGVLWFLTTPAPWDKLPGILLDHFVTYLRYEEHGDAQLKVSDPDGRVELDDREEELGDTEFDLE